MLSEETDSNRRHIVPLFKIEVTPSISLTKLSNIFQKIGKWKFVSSWMVVGQFAWIIIESDLRLTIRINRITYARSRLMSVLSFQWNGSQFHSFLRRLLLKNPSKHFCRWFWSPLTLSKNYISSFLFFLKQLENFCRSAKIRTWDTRTKIWCVTITPQTLEIFVIDFTTTNIKFSQRSRCP